MRIASTLKTFAKRVRCGATAWAAQPTLAYLESVRRHELNTVVELLPARGRLLEIGAGTGWQAAALEQCGYEVVALDLSSSNYRSDRVREVVEYDGRKLPFDDRTFDIVFSSNTLEHIPHVRGFQSEMQRVLRPGGMCVHLVPSTSWRFWTSLAHLLKRWRPPQRHGEHAANALTELWTFRRRWWARLFTESGWLVVEQRSNGLFYTGERLFDSRLSIDARRRLARWLGGSCNVFVLRDRRR